jgi:predicted aspartyl protease
MPSHAQTDMELAPVFTHLDRTLSIPAELAHGTLLVDVTVNGAGPFHMLVDTGCSGSIITPEVALAADAHSGDQPRYIEAINSLGATGSVQYVLLDHLELGAASFEGVSAGIASLDLQSRIAGTRIDGILGYTVFSDLFFALDFPGRRIVLSRNFPSEAPPIRSELAIQEDNNVPYVNLKLQQHDLRVMIDTGANDNLGLDRATAAKLEWKVTPRAAGLVAALGGTGRDFVGRIMGNAELGSITQPDPVVSVGTGGSRIGTGFLDTLCVVFNRSQNKLWLCRNSAGPLPSPAKRSVGFSLLADAAGWRVVDTIPDSPAANAGIHPGDVLTSIEEKSAIDWTRDAIEQWLDQHATLTVSVQSANGDRTLDLPIESLVP